MNLGRDDPLEVQVNLKNKIKLQDLCQNVKEGLPL